MGDAPNIPSPPAGLDWVKLRQDLEPIINQESTWQKVVRKFKQNPFVPIGATVTVGALSYGLFNFIRGESKIQQKMMRLRVAAQLFTVMAAVGGVFFALPKEKRNLQVLIERPDREANNQSSTT